MSSISQAYSSLSSSSPGTQVALTLQSIINALPSSIDKSTRAELISALLEDVQASMSGDSDSRLGSEDVTKALLALKSLGRNPLGSEQLAKAPTLSKLLSLAKSLVSKGNDDAASEALRCVANTVLLFEDSRSILISEEVSGGEMSIEMLDDTTNPDLIFVLSRILFFGTVSASSFIQSSVEHQQEDGRTVVDIIASKLEITVTSIMEGAKLGREAMTELLKFTFNLLLHYPKMVESEPQTSNTDDKKVMGDFWSSELDGLLAPLLKVYHQLPPAPLVSPLTNVIHALITIPVTPTLAPIWFANRNENSHDKHDVLQRTRDLLETSFSLYFPSNKSPDDADVRNAFTASMLAAGVPDMTPDDLLTPLVILCTRLCTEDEQFKLAVRGWIVPEDLDRTNPLDERQDFLGRCLRLLGSVYHTRLKDAVGEMLWAVSDQDASTMSTLFGYGHVAGFLFEKEIKGVPPPSGSSSSNAGASVTFAPSTSEANANREINPITGTYVTEEEKSKPPGHDMTEDEKQQEMEKLFVLFDRLEKTGTLPPEQNPMRKIIQKSMQQS